MKLAFDFDASVKDLPDTAKEAMLAQLKQLVTEKMTLWVGTDGTSVVQGEPQRIGTRPTRRLDQYFGRQESHWRNGRLQAHPEESSAGRELFGR